MFKIGDIVKITEEKRKSNIFHEHEMSVISLYKKFTMTFDSNVNEWHYFIICEYVVNNRKRKETYHSSIITLIRSSRKSRIRKLLN